MSNWVYTRDIPFASHNPSADQPVMQTNANSIDSLIQEDHFGFNDNNGGLHKQSTYVNESAPSTAAGQLALYSKGAPGGPSALYLIRDNNAGTETQLSSLTIGTAVAATTGASWLPGGLLIQWGSFTMTAVTTAQTITFLNPFSTTNALFPLPIVTISPGITNVTPIGNRAVEAQAFTNVDFQAINGSGVVRELFWTAIGAG
jgi:hypothetical protein